MREFTVTKMIECKNLSKSFGDKKVLDGVSLSVSDGSVVGLVGINGAGKSTLLRILSGVLRADEGEALYDGEPVYENERAKRDIFFLADDPYFDLSMTGEKLKRLYRLFYPFDDAAFERYLEMFSLDPKKPVRTFSKGQRRQMFVSAAMACRPKYLFLDEAFDGLDPISRMSAKRGIVDLQSECGTTAIIASHSLRELEDICDRFALLDCGKIKAGGEIFASLGQMAKFRLSFDREISREDFPVEIVSLERSGKVVTIVARGEAEEAEKKLAAMNPVFLENIPMDFEDLFVSEVKSGEGEK